MASTHDGLTPDTAFPLARLSQLIQGWINKLGEVWVIGQLVQISQRGNGWVYMTLRDQHVEASMDLKATAVVFESAGPLPHGSVVTARVKADYWTKNGRLSLNATQLMATGEGQLLAQLEQRKRLLQAEGLFDAARKKPLPFLPRVIGVITGKDSAAEADVRRNVANRWPGACLDVQHVLVQGPECARQVMAALHRLDMVEDVDVIIIARGGGSLEDLLPFSDEGLVRTVAACRTPVVSAVGHETDNPIVDYVADLRVSTPTAAAKAVVPDAAEEQRRIIDLRRRLMARPVEHIVQQQRWLDQVRSRPVLQNPAASVDAHAERVSHLREQLRRSVGNELTKAQQDIAHLVARGRALSPRATLRRGYTILATPENASVASAAAASIGQPLKAIMTDGTIDLTVTDISLTPDQQEAPA